MALNAVRRSVFTSIQALLLSEKVKITTEFENANSHIEVSPGQSGTIKVVVTEAH